MKRLLLLLLVLLTMGPALPLRAQEAAAQPVYVIPIRGMIEPALLYVIRRGLAEAQEQQARAVVFVMDTPGGRVDAATEIVRTIQKIQVPTYTFVEKDAFSAGAIIALATDHIYMAPGSVIGDAMPIMMSPVGTGPQEMPEALQEKTVSAVAALIRSAAQESGHDAQLAEKMVRREGEYRIGDDLIARTNQLLTLTNVEAERLVHRDEGSPEPLLSKGTVADLDALMEKLGLAQAPRRDMVVTRAEHIARYLAALAPILLALGALGVYVEIKTPGFGLPGLLGGVCLALYFWGHHIAGLSGMEEVVLFVIGAALLILELLFFPTAGLAGLGGVALMLVALVMAMVQHFPGGPLLPTLPELKVPLIKLSVAILLTLPAAIATYSLLPRTRAFARISLRQATSRRAGFSAVPNHTERIGQIGVAVSALRPSGSGRFEGVQLDVMSRGTFIEAGRPIRIVAAEAGCLVVEEVSA